MAAEKTLVYLILGAAGSGRREVLADLIAGGLAETDRPATFLSDAEQASEHDAKLGQVVRWRWLPERQIEAPALPEGAGPVFFVTDGRANPVDQIEAFHGWLGAVGGELGRVLCVVHCRLAEKHSALLAWYDACVHFSDVALLHQRDGVANKWMGDFQKRYQAQFLPCLFEMVKHGGVKNPLMVLEPQARRMAHLFDEAESTEPVEHYELSPGTVFIDETGEDTDIEALVNPTEEPEEPEEPDPYLARKQGGRRVKEIPDLRKYLDAAE